MPRPRPRSRVRLRTVARLTGAALVCAAGVLAAVMCLARPAAAVNDIPAVISGTRNWLVGILSGLATLFLTVAGVRYLMAGGDPGEVEKAKGALKAAVVGYALAVLAPVLLIVLQGIVGAPGPEPGTPGPAPGPSQLRPAVFLGMPGLLGPVAAR